MANLKQQAYALIKQKIINSEYKPNEFLGESRVIEDLQLSRTPVREAMIALSQEGFLEIIPKRGIRVIPLSADDVISIFETRFLVEPWLALTYGPTISKEELLQEKELIKEEIDYNRKNNIVMPGISIKHHPHTLLLAKCGNRYIQNMLRHIEEQGQRIPDINRVNNSMPMPEMSDELYNNVLSSHIKIVDELLLEKYEDAAKTMREHIEIGKKEYLQYWFGRV